MKGRLSSSKQMETDNEESRLSGAYIRSLVVKHLNPLDGDNKNGECVNAQKQQSQPIQHKKQVRRRLHTSRPYQERLLNMAEARREIVTALKFHRASMRQQESVANNQLPQEKKQKYPSSVTNSYSSLSCPRLPPPPLFYHYYNNQDFLLPSQTLGLNLNFQNFSNLDTNLYQKPPSTSSVPPKEAVSGSLHHAMDDVEMEEIRSLGQQHQTEWNDTVNLVTSATSCNFSDEGDRFHQLMEFPPWLINSNESLCLDHHYSDAYFQDPVLPCLDIGEIEAMDGEWLA